MFFEWGPFERKKQNSSGEVVSVKDCFLSKMKLVHVYGFTAEIVAKPRAISKDQINIFKDNRCKNSNKHNPVFLKIVLASAKTYVAEISIAVILSLSELVPRSRENHVRVRSHFT